VYDGISPFIPHAIKVTGNNMKFPLVGRGSENPLKKVSACVTVSLALLGQTSLHRLDSTTTVTVSSSTP
jgi:hypothetical protein